MYINDVSLPSLVVAQPRGTYNSGECENRWVEVLVDYPGAAREVPTEAEEREKLYTYRLPPGLNVKPGDILSVPFGMQQLGGIAIRLLAQPPANLVPEKIRDVEDVVHPKLFRESYWQLLEQVSQYYYTPLIQVIRTALPPGLLGRSQARLRLKPENIPNGANEFVSLAAREILKILQSQADGNYSFKFLKRQVKGFYQAKKQLLQRGWVESYVEMPRYSRPQTKPVVTLIVNVPPLDLSNRQREILEVLRRHGGELWLQQFLEICNTTTPTLKRLEEKGCIVIEEREVLRTERGPVVVADLPKSLNAAQSQALSTIREMDGYGTVLLHGVTGSGKTEVYLQAIAPLLTQGKSALVLVPEIGLTPQLTDRFRARFGNKVSVYHSALSGGERYDTWRQMLTGEPQVVIGTRSAVFAPLPNLGLIILDEEHDSSFKQDSPIPTYHARTVAQWRAELENCLLILGSATPSLESLLSIGETSPPSPLSASREGEQEIIQNLQSSTQNLQSSTQNLQSSTQNLQSSTQNQQSTIQNQQLSTQNQQLSTQNQQLSTQNQQSITQNQQLSTQKLQSTTQNQQLSTQNLQSITQNQLSTTQNLQSTTQNPKSAIDNPKSKIQNPKSYYLSLPERINSRPLPPVEVVDMRQELHQGNRSIFSRSLQDALQQLKQRGQQGILFIHRRGHSTFVSCRSCGYVLECPYCDVSLSYHHTEENAPQILRCHYCNYSRSHPKNCPECTSPYLKFFGSGTQRVEQELKKQFPELRLIRFDSDTTRTKGAHRTLLTKFVNGEADLLVGTQMLTKGLDLPQVTLVGVVAADGLLHLSDYRASERAFQTLTQVAGRAGRGEDPGRVIVQTYTPEHPVIEAVRNHDYQSFTDAELEQRQALNYPPYGRLILLRLSSFDPVEVENVAQMIASALPQQEGLDILGPAQASIVRVANRYRWQIMLKFAPDALPQLPDWEEVQKLCPKTVSLTIDVDPLNIM